MTNAQLENQGAISRKDTIVIAMLVNMAILFVLFATASKQRESSKHPIPLQAQPAPQIVHNEVTYARPANPLPVDEIDEILEQYAQKKETHVEKVQSLNQLDAPPLKVAPKTQKKQEPEYYIVKNGDNPWKIAKKFNIKFEELLRLNDLDEEKARNLKIGQKLRIR